MVSTEAARCKASQLLYFLQREWSSRSSHGNPGGPSRNTRVGRASDQEVENISFKSYSRDSGHGGSEQEDSPRSHNPTTTLNSLNNLRSLNNSKDTRRQPYMPPDYHQGITNDLTATVAGQGDPEPYRERDCRAETEAGQPGPRMAKRPNSNLLRSASPWNHTYTEIQSKAPDDPVYEEIERGAGPVGEIQVSDMSDEDGKRQSDVSRQSSRSYGDHRPLIPYGHSCLDSALKQRLYSSESASARTVAVLDGETVVCHLQPEHDLYSCDPYNSRTILPPYSEC